MSEVTPDDSINESSGVFCFHFRGVVLMSIPLFLMYFVDVPVVNQLSMRNGEMNCAVAVATMVYRYFGYDVNYNELVPVLREGIPVTHGISLSEIIEHTPGVTDGRWSARFEWTDPKFFQRKVETELTSDRPVIVAVQNGTLLGWDFEEAHSLVIIGMDETHFYYIDPYGGIHRRIEIEKFINQVGLWPDHKNALLMFEKAK
jgi:hypothetical protein